MILIPSLLTPLPPITFQPIHPHHIFSPYVLLTFPFIPPPTIPSTLPLLTPLILPLPNIPNLYHITLLPFSPLLPRLLKHPRKPRPPIRFILPSLLISL
ncbi:hypothetical protein, partial [Bacillus altitudinis]|uniref:hypothetical protein n=1 Tax=Bacillus altitudinis TaxID=293387 RepID=UPI003B52D0EF